MNDKDDYPSRVGDGTEAEKRHIDILIARLLELRESTNPARGDDTAKGKDLAAFQALKTAGELVRALAGWAVDHQVGLAIEGLSFFPPLGPVRGLPGYDDARAAVDTHAHERTGGHADAEVLSNPMIVRQIGINMIATNSGWMPPTVAIELETSLKALAMGDVRPALAPALEGRKVTLAEQGYQLQALAFWEFRKKSGVLSSASALDRVAAVFGVSSDTLRHWAVSLRADDRVGPLEVGRALGMASNKASWVRAQISVLSKAVSMLENDETYGDAPLAKAAERYRAEVRRRAAS